MSPTLLLTGSSTGIGRATAFHFQKMGWSLAASMRSPEKEQELGKLKGVICPALDVTKPEIIHKAIRETIARFGTIDVVVNNAGYGLVGPFENTTPEQIRRQFETNLFGMMEVVRELLPHFRERGSGVIVNVASMGGRTTFPLYSVYHASKWAVEGYSESLAYELRPFGIRVKIVEPGAIQTDFYTRSADLPKEIAGGAYQKLFDHWMPKMNSAGKGGSSPDKVAATIFRAATDGSARMRYPVGSDACSLLFLRRLVPDQIYQWMVRRALR